MIWQIFLHDFTAQNDVDDKLMVVAIGHILIGHYFTFPYVIFLPVVYVVHDESICLAKLVDRPIELPEFDLFPLHAV